MEPMKLCSIINAWVDTIELLPFVIENHLRFCDGVIVVWSSVSNHGNVDGGKMESEISKMFEKHIAGKQLSFIRLDPNTRLSPLVNETQKRNFGIDTARHEKYTHFILADADEFYLPDQMNIEKRKFDNSNLNGLVHPLKVYIKIPTLYTYDHTLCCGIHKLNPNTYAGQFKEYPFCYDDKGQAHIDPSRRLNFTSGIEISLSYMHHYSYVRKNIDLKIDNSSANLRRSRQVIYDELRDAKPGYVSRLYHQPLQECENYFNIEL